MFCRHRPTQYGLSVLGSLQLIVLDELHVYR